MALSHDTSAESHTGTTGSTSEASFPINITIGAGAKGLVVFVFTLADADYLGTVTLDSGGSLTQFAEAADTAGEPMRATGLFMANPGTGARVITVNRTNNATVMYAIAHSVNAASDVEVYAPGIVLLQESQTLSEQSVDDGSPGTNSLRLAFVCSGSFTAPPAGANSTAGQGIQTSNASCRSFYETTAGQGSRPIGASLGTTDDVAAIHCAIREVPASGAKASWYYQNMMQAA